jgi:hypothetical protein
MTKGEVSTMESLKEKEIKAYRLKTKKTAETKVVAEDVIHDQEPTVCPVCATDEEKATATKVVAEDVIHDSKPMLCVRCQKKIK